MEFKVCRTWEWDNAKEMEFSTLEELLEFTKQEQEKSDSVSGTILYWSEIDQIWNVEIYDGYRE